MNDMPQGYLAEHSRYALVHCLCALLAGAAVAVSASPSPYEPPAMSPVPVDGRITITDYGYRDWPPALLHYSLGGRRLKAGPVALADKDGKHRIEPPLSPAAPLRADHRRGDRGTVT